MTEKILSRKKLAGLARVAFKHPETAQTIAAQRTLFIQLAFYHPEKSLVAGHKVLTTVQEDWGYSFHIRDSMRV